VRNVDSHHQPILESDLLDLEVTANELELFVERDFLIEIAVERQAEKLAESREHCIGGFDVAVHQRRDRVQRVEKEMRLELHLERLQLRARELRREMCAAQLAIAILHVVIE